MAKVMHLIQVEIDEAVQKIYAEQEKFILSYFGNDEELAKKEIHRYVFETYEIEYEMDLEASDIIYTVSQQYRLRLKTPEELEAEQMYYI